MFLRENSYWWDISRREIVKQAVNKNKLTAKSKILDAGCGEGTMLSFLQSKFPNSFGIDNSVYALEFCKKRGLSNLKLANLEKKIPFKNNFFNAIVCLEVIEHTNNDNNVVKEFYRVLKQGGKLFLTVPAYNFLWSKHDESIAHKRRYDRGQLKILLFQNDFKVITASYFFSFLLLPAIFIHPKKETAAVNKLISSFLLALCSLERQILNYFSLPFGISIIVVAQKI